MTLQHNKKYTGLFAGKECVTYELCLNFSVDDDKWYSSDEEEENKPNVSNILNTLTNPVGQQCIKLTVGGTVTERSQ